MHDSLLERHTQALHNSVLAMSAIRSFYTANLRTLLEWTPLMETDFSDILFTVIASRYIRYDALRSLPILPGKLGGCQVL